MATIVLAYKYGSFAADSTLTIGTDISASDAASLVGNGEARWGTAGPLSSSGDVLPLWTANTVYPAQTEILDPTGTTILVRKTTGTSRSTYDTTEQALWSAGAGGGGSLTPTAVKTANYTAVAGDLVPVDTTSGNITVTLPTAPADKTQIGVKHVIRGGTNTVTVTCGGSDVFNKTGGSSTGTLSLVDQGKIFQYKASGAIWYAISDDLALSQLDARYAPAGSSGAGVVKPGVFLPAGSFPVAGPALKSAVQGSTLAMVLAIGDSKTWGQSGSGGSYSWFSNRLRERLVADYGTAADGGRGYNIWGADAAAPLYGSEPAHIASRTGFAAAFDTFVYDGQIMSSTANDNVTFNVVGTRARIWWSRSPNSGRFSYQVNGGAVVTVNGAANEAPALPGVAGSQFSPDYVMLTNADGLTTGTNTVKITNLGGGPAATPQATILGATSGGSLAASTTYYYCFTKQTSVGHETTKSNVVSSTTSGSNLTLNPRVLIAGATPPDSGGTYNVFRSTSSGGPFYYIGQLAGQASFLNGTTFSDDGSVTPDSAHQPPATSTADLDPAVGINVRVAVQEFNANGVLLDNHGIQGTRSWSHFDTLSATNDVVSAATLGLQWGTASNGIGSGVGTDAEFLPSAQVSGVDTPMVRATAPVPKLVILQLPSVNDEGSMDDITLTNAAPTVADGGVGIGSGLAAATYFYKVARVLPQQFGGYSPLSPAGSAAITAGHQAIVTTPGLPQGDGMPTWGIFRSTSSSGTYSYVGQVTGATAQFIDNVANPGAAYAAAAQVTIPADPWRGVRSLRRGIRMARNAGADVLVILPDQSSGPGELHNGAVIRAAAAAECMASSVPFIDFDYALSRGSIAAALTAGYGGANANVHRTAAAYQVQGDFLYDNVIKPLIAGTIT